MKKRLLSVLLATVLLASSVLGLFLPTSATVLLSEPSAEANEPSISYEEIYIKDGLISWFNPLSTTAGTEVVATLPDSSGNGNSFTLSKLKTGYTSAWSYGDGYLQFDTGSQLKLNGILTPPATDAAKQGYTIEYNFTHLDQAPQGANPAAGFADDAPAFARTLWSAYTIGGMTMSTRYVDAANRAILKGWADAYAAAKADESGSPAGARATFSFTYPESNAADMTAYDTDASGDLNYEETAALLADESKSKRYYPLTEDYSVRGLNGILKSSYNLNGNWGGDVDWKTAKNLLSMSPDSISSWLMTFDMTGVQNGEALTTTTALSIKNLGDQLVNSTKTTNATVGVAGANMVLAADLATRVYGIRIYNRILSQQEADQNHFADLAGYSKADLSGYHKIMEHKLPALYAAFSTVSMSTDKAVLKQQIEDAIDEALHLTYNDLYVKNNVVVNMDGFASTAANVLTNQNKAGHATRVDAFGNTFTFQDTVVWGSNAEAADGYIATKGDKFVVTFTDAALASIQNSDVTYEIIYAYETPAAVAEKTSAYSVLNLFGAVRLSTNSIPTKTFDTDGVTVKDYAGMNDPVFCVTNYDNGTETLKENQWFANLVDQPLLAGEDGTVNAFTLKRVLHDHASYTAGKAIKYTAMNGENKIYETASSQVIEYISSYDSRFEFGNYCNLKLYAVRVYNKELTDAERHQNHFADLVGISGADPTGYADIVDFKKAALHTEFSHVSMSTDKAVLKQQIEDAIADALALSYDDLYVQEDLVFSWDAFDMAAGDTVSATAVDRKDPAKAVAITTSKATAGDGYLLYSGTFDLSALVDPAKDITFELALALNPNVVWSDTVGTVFTGVTDQWSSNARIGVVPNTANNWQIHARNVEDNHPYDKSFGFVSGSWISSSNNGIGKNIQTDLNDTTPRFFGNYIGASYSIAFVLDYGADRAVNLKLMRDGVLSTSPSNNATGTYSGTYPETWQDDARKQCSFTQLNGAAYYAVRMYSAALTEAQLQQNHFADLAGFSGADLSLYEQVPDKAALHAAFREVQMATYVAETDSVSTDKAALKAQIENSMKTAINTAALNKLYVDGGNLVVNLNAITASAGQALTNQGTASASITDAKGNTFRLGANAVAADGYIATKGDKFVVTFTDAALASIQNSDMTYEIIYAYETPAAVAEKTSAYSVLNLFGAVRLSTSSIPTKTFDTDGVTVKDYAGMNDPVFCVTNYDNGTETLKENQWFADLVNKPLLAGEDGTVNAFTLKRVLHDHASYTAGKAIKYTAMNGENKIYETASSQIIEYISSYDSRFEFGQLQNLKLYAVRVYNKALTSAEKHQNHFADLANYCGADVVDYVTIKDKGALHAQFVDVQLTAETDKAALKADIEAAIAAANELNTAASTIANEVVSFDGFQARVLSYPGLRSRYTINISAEGLAEGNYTLVEVGAIMALADKFSRDQLTVTEDGNGYVVEREEKGIASAYVYRDGSLLAGKTFNDIEGTHFAFTTTYNGDYNKTHYQAELIYRAYVVLEKDGINHTCYIDAVGETFPTGIVSMISLSEKIAEMEGFAGNEMIDKVISAFTYAPVTMSANIEAGNAEGVWEMFNQKVNELPDEMPVAQEKIPQNYPGSMLRQYYVATNGNDTNAGTIDAPFATLQRALDAIETKGGGVIWLRGGTYTITETPKITEAHSGVGIPTFIAAYNGETVAFTASRSVASSSLQTVDAAISAGLIGEAVRTKLNTFTSGNAANVYVTKLPDDMPIDATAQAFLYIDNVPFHSARYPNVDAVDAANGIKDGRVYTTNTSDSVNDIKKVGKVIINSSSLYKEHKNDVGGWEIYYDTAYYANRINTYDLTDTQLYVYGAVYEEWNRQHHGVTLVKDDGDRDYMVSDSYSNWGAKENAGNNLYFYNVLEELDAENEYFIDQTNKLLYVWSATSLSGTDIRYAAGSQALLDVKDATNVTIDGIHFTGANTTAVTAQNNTAVVFQNCTFSKITGAAISMTNSVKCGLLDCEFFHFSAQSTFSGKIDELKPTENFMQNCYFHDPYDTTDTAIYVGGMSDVISHNLFEDCKLGINGAYECVVEYNEFDRGSQKTHDGGPIYMSLPNHKSGNHIRYNLLHNLNYSRYGIYLDDVSSGNYVYGNIIEYAEENSGGGKCVNIHSGSRNVVYNNIGLRAATAGILDAPNYYVSSIDGTSTGYGGALGSRWPAVVSSAVAAYDTLMSTWGEEAFKARFPMLYEYGTKMKEHQAQVGDDWTDGDRSSTEDALEIELRTPASNVYIDNVMIDCGADKLTAEGISAIGKETGKLENNLAYSSTSTELLFVDAENDNYNFAEGSPVYSAISDFKTIPFAKIGRHK